MHALQESGIQITDEVRRLPQATFWQRDEEVMVFHFTSEIDCSDLMSSISTNTDRMQSSRSLSIGNTWGTCVVAGYMVGELGAISVATSYLLPNIYVPF